MAEGTQPKKSLGKAQQLGPNWVGEEVENLLYGRGSCMVGPEVIKGYAGQLSGQVVGDLVDLFLEIGNAPVHSFHTVCLILNTFQPGLKLRQYVLYAFHAVVPFSKSVECLTEPLHTVPCCRKLFVNPPGCFEGSKAIPQG